jgi:hypothetical protein
MYDSVWVECPKCGQANEFQSKGGDCLLNNYNLQKCPDDVMSDINRHSPYRCECGAVYEVDINNRMPVLINHN